MKKLTKANIYTHSANFCETCIKCRQNCTSLKLQVSYVVLHHIFLWQGYLKHQKGTFSRTNQEVLGFENCANVWFSWNYFKSHKYRLQDDVDEGVVQLGDVEGKQTNIS